MTVIQPDRPVITTCIDPLDARHCAPGKDFSTDPDRLSRFERKARLLASLNHPNIGAIYDLAESNATKLFVLELVPGETLAEAHVVLDN